MANEKNLQPVKSKKEARERGRNGGIASGKARRKKKSMLQCAESILSRDMKGSLKDTVEKLTGELADDEDTLFTAMTAVMVKEALKGNTRAFNSLKDMVIQIEEKQAEREIDDDPLTKSLEELSKGL